MAEQEDDGLYHSEDRPMGSLDDLSKLTSLSEETLLHELKFRYEQDHIYTYVGDILIAVNPFKELLLYTEEVAKAYCNIMPSDQSPHVFAIADACYHNLFKMRRNQCAVISGESGAGKTVSAKYIIRHIIDISSVDSEARILEDRIVEVSPLLEAFGNAQTIMNDNSSRFGKYTRLLFDAQGRVMGVQISEYLLEKSRVIEQHADERCFHVFYYLFASENNTELGLTVPEDFGSLCGELWPDNATMYRELIEAMKLVGFSSIERDVIHKTLAAILHISNIQFTAVDEDSCMLQEGSKSGLKWATSLLGIDEPSFREAILAIHSVTRGERIKRPYTKDQSYDCRDAVAKALYARLFSWIVSKINEKLAPSLHNIQAARPGVKVTQKAPSFEIGVLDIFGFENFHVNSFEQLCINVAHEQLQFFFNQHTFRLELQEYEAECVDSQAASISFVDNKPLIDMFLNRPLGIFALLDEECAFPRATDVSFVDKINKQFDHNEFYRKVVKSRGFPTFAIAHFPGVVEYNATHFLEKNRDNLAADIIQVMQQSSVPLVYDVFSSELNDTGQLKLRAGREAHVHRGEIVEDSLMNTANRKAPSLSSQFKSSLTDLVNKMTACFPHFVRCIKPNQRQVPDAFEDDFVKTQLGYTGVLEATRIRREGFSWRPTFAEFVRRFKILGFPTNMLSRVQENSTAAKKILGMVDLQPVLVGKTKLFLKWYHQEEMEDRLRKYYADVVRVQSAARAFFARKIYKRKLARAQMDAAERAKAEAREAEEERRREEARIERQRREAAERAVATFVFTYHWYSYCNMSGCVQKIAAQASRMAELARMERERAEAEARAAEEVRKSKEAELLRMEAAARKAEAEAKRVAELARIEEEKIQHDRSISQAEMAEEERTKALEEAAKAREAEIRALEQAEELREAKARAEAEAESMRLQRAASIAQRKEAMERLKRDADEKNNRVTELQHLLDEAMSQASDAEVRALKAEAALSVEEAKDEMRKATKEEELKLAAIDSGNFDFNKWIEHVCSVDIPKEIKVDKFMVQGPVSKTGSAKRAWKQRWFVADAARQCVAYFDNDKMKKEKGVIRGDQIIRVFSPKAAGNNMFMIETPDRTYFCKASPEAVVFWVQVLSIFPRHYQQEE
eukprot:gene2905-8162_t